MKSDGKMNWLINEYNSENGLTYEIHDACVEKNKLYKLRGGLTKGTIVMPTGAGKSGVMYKDIIYHIKDAIEHEPSKKIVFNLSAPILKLCRQSASDLFDAIGAIFGKKGGNERFMIFINSSDTGDYYKDCTQTIGDIHPFSDIGMFIESTEARFAFVISCHHSLCHFTSKLKYIKQHATTIIYLDEAHLCANLGEADRVKKADQEEKTYGVQLNVLRELCTSHYVYAVTATPDKYVTGVINQSIVGMSEDDFEKDIQHEYIIDIPAQELIEKGTILRPKVFTKRIPKKSKLSANACVDFMDICKSESPEISHKVLISADDTDHLMELECELKSMGYTVFSTCSKNGTKKTKNKDEFVNVDEADFINEVDKFDGDCFVIHIKQLRQGVDIRTLTDCILTNKADQINEGRKNIYIQTIGRVLRPYKGERPEELEAAGKTLNDRKKEFGCALFVVSDEYTDINGYNQIESQAAKVLLTYYGIGNFDMFSFDLRGRIENPHEGCTDSRTVKVNCFGPLSLLDEYEYLIEEMRLNIKNYIKEYIIPIQNMLELKLGVSVDDINDAIERIEIEFAYDIDDIPLNKLLTDEDLLEIVRETLSDCGAK